MRAETTFFHCGDQLMETLRDPIRQVLDIVDAVKWAGDFEHSYGNATYQHQTAYNRAFTQQFAVAGWESQPVLRTQPKLIGDFRKGLVFVEVQFGNSATLYRDYYKFQYGLANGLLSLAVLIVPSSPAAFFPSRPDSVNNMADYKLASTCLSVLPINVPTMLIGLLPSN